MPILTPDAGLPLLRRARRVLVAGPSGAGKTTLAQHLGRALGAPHHEAERRPELPIVRVRSRAERRRLVEALRTDVTRHDTRSSQGPEKNAEVASDGGEGRSESRRMSTMRLREIITSRTPRSTRARAERQ